MKLRTLMLGFFGSVVVGFASSLIEWRPNERVVQTGFPFPIGVLVRLDDGSWDCGVGFVGWLLNPLSYLVLFFAVAGVVGLVARFRKAHAT